MRARGVMVVAASALSWSTVAFADEVVDPTRSPGFVTMLRQDANSRAGADMTYFNIDGGSSGTLLRFDLHGHYVDPASGVGGYAQLPITHISATSTSETMLGGAELGGIYIPKLSAPNLGLVVRAGLTLPTVSDDNDEALTGILATLLRPSDLMTMLPRTSTLRLAASPMVRSGSFFGRLDGGIDINLYADGNETVDPALLINGGVGVDTGAVAIMGEISMLAITGDNGESFSSAALSVRGNAGAVQLYGALLIPVDNDVNEIFDPSILVGIEGRL